MWFTLHFVGLSKWFFPLKIVLPFVPSLSLSFTSLSLYESHSLLFSHFFFLYHSFSFSSFPTIVFCSPLIWAKNDDCNFLVFSLLSLSSFHHQQFDSHLVQMGTDEDDDDATTGERKRVNAQRVSNSRRSNKSGSSVDPDKNIKKKITPEEAVEFSGTKLSSSSSNRLYYQVKDQMRSDEMSSNEGPGNEVELMDIMMQHPHHSNPESRVMNIDGSSNRSSDLYSCKNFLASSLFLHFLLLSLLENLHFISFSSTYSSFFFSPLLLLFLSSPSFFVLHFFSFSFLLLLTLYQMHQQKRG